MARFNSVQDWFTFLNDIQKTPSRGVDINFLDLRLNCYSEIEKIRGRSLLVYFSKFLINDKANVHISIELSDVDGFTDLINSIPIEETTIDVLIHSPGGFPDATERIVYLLRERFEEVHFLVPHSAYSAATMLALSGDSITLHNSASLGPIDPQIGGVPARSIKNGFNKVKESITPETLPAYLPLIGKYSLELLELCEDSETLSKELVSKWLKDYMLKEEKFPGQIAEVVKFFSDYELHLLHSRPLVLSKLMHLGLNLKVAEDPLNSLLWEAYILMEGFFHISNHYKVFENTKGISWGRQDTFIQQIPVLA